MGHHPVGCPWCGNDNQGEKRKEDEHSLYRAENMKSPYMCIFAVHVVCYNYDLKDVTMYRLTVANEQVL